METEELKLLRENNYMLKLIIMYLNKKGTQNRDMDEFLINVLANKI